jgi:type II secretory pathway pseudopilin PulG
MNPHHNTRTGFSLIEVTIALGIAAFCLITVFGLLPIGLDSSQNAAEQTVVSGIATAVSADLHSTPLISSTGTTTSRFGLFIPPANQITTVQRPQVLFFTQDGELAGPVNSNAAPRSNPPRYRATITIKPDKALLPLAPTIPDTLYKVWIFITWPALADSQADLPPQNFMGSYEIVTSLNFFNN